MIKDKYGIITNRTAKIKSSLNYNLVNTSESYKILRHRMRKVNAIEIIRKLKKI